MADQAAKAAKKAAEKALKKEEKEGIIKKLKDGILETISNEGGVSEVWKKFYLIRSCETKKVEEYVQCRQCKKIVTHARNCGTSNLKRHNCKDVDMEDEEYKFLTEEKLETVQSLLMEKIIFASAKDAIPIEVFWGQGYIDLAQAHVSIADKNGNVNMKTVYPSLRATKRKIVEMKEKVRRELLDEFKDAYEKGWCCASIEIVKSNGILDKSMLMAFSIQYFAEELTMLKRKHIFSIGFDSFDNAGEILRDIISHFKDFGGEASNLQGMKIVTPFSKIFKDAVWCSYSLKDCVVMKIIYILKSTFEWSTEATDFLDNCRSIIRYVTSSGRFGNLKCDDDGSWKCKASMVTLLVKHYEDVMEILDEERKVNFVLKKKEVEEMAKFLEPFIAALEDLKSTNYPTANKIALWWDELNNHFQECSSIGLKLMVLKAKSVFQSVFRLTMDNKIDCFLDPRYKDLAMFDEPDRKEVYLQVRQSIREIKSTAGIAESTENAEPSAPKKNRFSKYECTVSERKNDEVGIYLESADLKSIEFKSEADVVLFWKTFQKKYPQLFHLAMTRLNVPASCLTNGHNELVQHNLTDESLNSLILIKNNFEEK